MNTNMLNQKAVMVINWCYRNVLLVLECLGWLILLLIRYGLFFAPS